MGFAMGSLGIVIAAIAIWFGLLERKKRKEAEQAQVRAEKALNLRLQIENLQSMVDIDSVIYPKSILFKHSRMRKLLSKMDFDAIKNIEISRLDYWIETLDFHFLTTLAWALNMIQDLTQTFNITLDLNLARAQALDMARSRNQDLNQDQALALAQARDRDIAQDLLRALTRDLDRDIFRDLNLAMVRDIALGISQAEARDLNLTRDIVLELDLAYNLERALDMAQSLVWSLFRALAIKKIPEISMNLAPLRGGFPCGRSI